MYNIYRACLGQLTLFIPALICYYQFKQYQMSQNEVANSPFHYRAQKNHFFIEIKLRNHSDNPILVIAIRNTSTNTHYLLEIDNLEISRDKTLNKLLSNTQELYHELVKGFQEIKIEDKSKYIVMKYEIKIGMFKKELITFQIKQRSLNQKQTQKVPVSPSNAKRKIYIDKSYTRDFNSFKDDFVKISDKISSKEILGKLNISNDRNSRIKIKNMFVSFANTILKAYRKHIEFTDIQITQEECFTQPANKLLTQKNELLQNTLLKAIKRIKETPTQQIDINFIPEIPNDLLIVMQSGSQVPLEKYLNCLPMQQIQNRIRYHQKRRERIMKAYNQVNQLKKQKGEQMNKLMEKSMSEKRNTRVSFSKVNPTDTSDFDEF